MGRLQHVCFNNMTYDLKAHIVIYILLTLMKYVSLQKLVSADNNKMNIDFK